jgi:DNA-binding NtrC family response regulator
MPLASQAKILRVLHDREVTRIGAKASVSVDIRIVTATHKDLHKEVQAGRFREDLYFRINVARLHIPPLRQRPSDIHLLAKSFLDIAAEKMSRPGLMLAPETSALLTAYGWPGNVRELENEMERLAALSSSGRIGPEDLSPHIRHPRAGGDAPVDGGANLLQETEKQLILRVLREVDDNKSEAARRLGISREGLRQKRTRYGID